MVNFAVAFEFNQPVYRAHGLDHTRARTRNHAHAGSLDRLHAHAGKLDHIRAHTGKPDHTRARSFDVTRAHARTRADARTRAHTRDIDLDLDLGNLTGVVAAQDEARSSAGFQMTSQRWPSGSWKYPE